MIMRQGDVLIQRVDEKLAKGEKVPRDGGRVVLAYGEVTHHAHAILAKNCTLFRCEDDTRYMVVTGRAVTLKHEEHSPIRIPPGIYRVRRQAEWMDEPIQVAD